MDISCVDLVVLNQFVKQSGPFFLNSELEITNPGIKWLWVMGQNPGTLCTQSHWMVISPVIWEIQGFWQFWPIPTCHQLSSPAIPQGLCGPLWSQQGSQGYHQHLPMAGTKIFMRLAPILARTSYPVVILEFAEVEQQHVKNPCLIGSCKSS